MCHDQTRGIFFRAIPGEYQQGYEAQIRNQFTAKPTQKYTIDCYQTNVITGTNSSGYTFSGSPIGSITIENTNADRPGCSLSK